LIHIRNLLCLSCLLWAPAVSAQVLPSKGQEGGGDVAPHVTCTSCQTRNYTYPSTAQRDESNRLITWCATCKQDRPHEATYDTDLGLSGGARAKGQGGLKLRKDGAKSSETPQSTAPVSVPQPVQPSAPEAAAQTAPVPPTASVDPAASFVFAGLRKQRSPDERLLAQAVDSLIAMGPQGIAAARAEIGAKEASVVSVAGRVLLSSKEPSDHELVLQCLRLSPPAGAGAMLLSELMRVDPVRVPPRVLIEFMDAREPGLRLAATREMRTRLQPELLPEIETALATVRADARLELLTLAGDLDTPEATRVLLTRLADPASRVAAQVLSELAGRKDADLDSRLLQQAFGGRWILRSQAYALLALVEREDLAQRAILNDTHITPLLEVLESQDSFVAGASAAALAGIGFRSARADTRQWLDQGVVDRLVAISSGKVFHNDFLALQAPVSRRLRQVTGQEFTEGPRWVSWWLDQRAGFRAQRAQLVVGEGEAARLAVSFRADGTGLLLLGPGEPEPVSLAPQTTVFRTTLEEAQSLLELMGSEGVLGADRLPGVRGARGPRERQLSVSIAGRSKQFLLGTGVEEVWFERCVSALRALADSNRWQQYPTPGKHVSRADLWAQASGWWSSHRDPAERALALKQLVFAMLTQTRQGEERSRGLAELARIYREFPRSAAPDDFRTLLGLMRGAGPQELGSLVRMATLAALSFDEDRREIPREMARELVQSVEDPALLEVICDAAPLTFVQSLLAETRPDLRAAGARALGKRGGPESIALLQPLLGDKVPVVEAAAVESLGRLKAESARTELLVRARLGLEPVRIAALRAIGELKGEFVLDALLLGLSDRNPTIRAAAVEGMGALDDATTAPFLISLLAEGSSSEVYEPARAAVRRLNARARADLERISSSPTHRARLEAAVLLGEMCDPLAAPTLLGALTLNPRDARLAFELAVLTCIDQTGQPDPAGAWWEWWDGVVHDNAQAWLRAACERLSIAPVGAEELQPPLRESALAFCMELMRRPESWLAERGRRELARILGEVLPPLPPPGATRRQFLDELHARLKKSS
jgi:HEAT repeat protein